MVAIGGYGAIAGIGQSPEVANTPIVARRTHSCRTRIRTTRTSVDEGFGLRRAVYLLRVVGLTGSSSNVWRVCRCNADALTEKEKNVLPTHPGSNRCKGANPV